MTVKEAREMLATAPRDEKPARLNPALTRKQAVAMVERSLSKEPEDKLLDSFYQKRVFQVCRDQRRPRF